MQVSSLDRLDWRGLLKEVAVFSHTKEGQQRVLGLMPGLDAEEIQIRWNETQPISELCKQGYTAPIGEVEPVHSILKAANLGQSLTGLELRSVLMLLESVQRISQFASDFKTKSLYLEKISAQIYSLPNLRKAIDRAIDPDGELKDDASPELTRIRKQKKHLRSKIEQRLKKLLRDNDLEKYMQDDFYTVRSERYVVPVSLDGRGRVKGSILDTSSSGQTLFIEPNAVRELNDELHELDLAEKLEIIRIFKELSHHVAKETEVMAVNYDEIIHLDFISSQAQYAAKIKGNRVSILKNQGVNLISARHPLLGEGVIANSVNLKDHQKALVISGPNAGGKTVILKTVGLLHVMLKSGLLLPCDRESELYLYSDLHIELGDAQSLSASLSTFSGHVQALSPILEKSNENDLVLLDELAVGTEPQTGAALAQAILERLVDNQATVLTTTHYDNLKVLAVNDSRFRNGSMEYSLGSFQPTYRLILDVPGQSYGLEVAKQHGFDQRLIKRASELRGASVSTLDSAINDLMVIREASRDAEEKSIAAQRQADSMKARWQHELEIFEKGKEKTLAQLKEKFELKFKKFKEDFYSLNENLKKEAKASRKNEEKWDQKESLAKQRGKVQDHLAGFKNELGSMSKLKNLQSSSLVLPQKKVG